MARAHGSYPWGREFKSPFRYLKNLVDSTFTRFFDCLNWNAENGFMDYLWTGFCLFTMAGCHHWCPPFLHSRFIFFHSRSNPAGSGCGPPPASISASAALNSCRSWSSDIPYRCCSSSSIGCNQHQLVKIKQKEAYPYRQKSDTPNSDAYGKRLGFLGGHISQTSRFTSASKK